MPRLRTRSRTRSPRVRASPNPNPPLIPIPPVLAPFLKGDIVKLKSGSESMTVIRVYDLDDDSNVTCQWFSYEKSSDSWKGPKTEQFTQEALILCDGMPR